jgi:hypothetical protein
LIGWYPLDRPPQEDQYYGPQFQGGQGGQARQPYFKYSQCKSKVGCNKQEDASESHKEYHVMTTWLY